MADSSDLVCNPGIVDDQPVVIVCSAGYASSLAAASLADLGFTHAADLDGGYQAWAAWAGARRADS